MSSANPKIFDSLGNRPRAWSASKVYIPFVISYIRGPLLATFCVVLISPFYFQAQKWMTELDISEPIQFAFMGTFVHELLYYGMGFGLMLIEAKGTWSEFKLPRTKIQIPSKELIFDTLKQSAIGHWIIQPITLYIIYPFFLSMTSPLPGFAMLMVQFAINKFTNRFLFYWAHRLVHMKQFYWIHKQHHKYTGSIVFAAEYANPIEQVLANQGPTVVASLFLGVHPLMWLVWLAWRLEQTYEVHSGYCFKGTFLDQIGLLHSEEARFHDHHHSRNYGSFGDIALDHLFGTMDAYIIDEAKRLQQDPKSL